MNESFSDLEPSDSPPVFPPQSARVEMPSLAPLGTYILIGFTVLIYLLQMASKAILNGDDLPMILGARVTELIRAGQWWRFITPVFLHGPIWHILINMYALFSIGSVLERYFGHKRFVTLYFLGAFAGNVFSFLLTNGYSIGASTAVFGLVGAELVFLVQNRQILSGQAQKAIKGTLLIIAVNLLIGLIPGLDAWANVGGLLGGAMFAWFAGPRWKVAGMFPDFYLEDQRESHEVVVAALTTLAVFGALAFWGLLQR